MRQIINSVADGVFIIDPKGLVSFWNPSMENISGYSAEEAIGKPCTLIACSSCDNKACEPGVTRCSFMENPRSETLECILKHKNGTDVPVIKKTDTVTDDQGRFLGIVEAVTDISELKQAKKKIEEATRQLSGIEGSKQMIGKSRALQNVFAAIKAAASSDATILIQGESGTGKELVAREIHYNSDRRDKPFVIVNCSALSESLLESELFGHVKGAYTGAIKDRKGRFEEAQEGSIFLDEIGELSPYIQVKLLRVLQEREIERVGDSVKRKVDIRIITATHRDLLEMVVAGTFREDLYYRLKVFPVKVPPLRVRKEDIPMLVKRFVEKMAAKTGKQINDLTPSAMKVLLEYHWPGNVRELENAIEHAFVLCNNTLICAEDLPQEILEMQKLSMPEAPPSVGMDQKSYKTFYDRISDLKYPQASFPQSYQEKLDAEPVYRRRPKVAKEQLLSLLEACDWNKKEVGRRIGVSHTAIWKYMKNWNIPLKKEIASKS